MQITAPPLIWTLMVFSWASQAEAKAVFAHFMVSLYYL